MMHDPFQSGSQVLDNLKALGRLIGVITEDDQGNIKVNAAWFANPVSQLTSIDQRFDSLVSLITSVMGTPANNAPKVFDSAKWYPIPNPKSGGKTPLHIVVPDSGINTGQMGLGFLMPYQVSTVTVQSSVYFPLITYAPSGSQFILKSNPVAINVQFTPKDKVQVAGISFTGITIDAGINLSGAAPTFRLEFVGLTGTSMNPVITKMSDLASATSQSLLSAALNIAQPWLQQKIGSLPVTVGQLLTAAGILKASTGNNNSPFALNLDVLKNLNPKQIALNFLFGGLDKLTAGGKPFIPLPGGGIYAVKRTNADQSASYGVRLAAAIPVSKDTSTQQVSLCFGQWLNGETDDENWITRCDGTPDPNSGICVYLLKRGADNSLGFDPELQITSSGLDIKGNNAPLFDIKGYTLQGAQLRANFQAGGAVSGISYGGAFRLDEFALPLGGSFNSIAGSGTNTVAQNLLQSGGGDDDQGDKDPVNPAFSLSAAYYKTALGSNSDVQLYDADNSPATVVLIPVQRQLGPLHCDKIGIGWVAETQSLSILFDGSVQLAALNIALQGLTVAVPVTDPFNYSKYDLDLDGMGITFSQGSIDLSAALVKVPATATTPYPQYNGSAVIKGGSFSIAAMGSYAYVPSTTASNGGYTSLFIFGMYIGNLGGPAFFYVTGLAAGFGYNRSIILPDQDHVTTFPLVAALNDPTILGGKALPNGNWSSPSPSTVLASSLSDYMPPERGQYWLAAGVRFTSFDLVHTSALLVVEFGNRTEISILGISWVSLPPPSVSGATPTKTYAYAELGIQVKFIPDEGVISATAILTPNSYVIDPACKLTGGFAFNVWFGNNEHAGEFVFTIGGYHPNFNVPAYYPQVPRLGFNWPVSGDVTISGNAYFALTSSAVMAGAGLQILFSSGNLKAWFTAQMDALITWAPFHYEVGISVSIGASYRMHLVFVTVTLKVELGAQLSLWGPSMGGRVNVNWYIISFSISFGADRESALPPLDWTNADGTGFAQTLLPHKSTGTQSPMMQAMSGDLSANPLPGVTPSGLYAIGISKGLSTAIDDAQGNKVWIVRRDDLQLSITTTFPATEVDITTADPNNPQVYKPADPNYFVCVRPMKATISASKFKVTLKSGTQVYDLVNNFDYDLTLQQVPAAKWGKPLPPNTDPEFNSMLAARLMGIDHISPKASVLTPSGSNALLVDINTSFGYETVDADNTKYLSLVAGTKPSGPTAQPDAAAIGKVQSSLMGASQVTARNNIYTALQQIGLAPATNGTLNVFAAAPGAVLTGNPFINQ